MGTESNKKKVGEIMEATKLKLIEFIINEATDKQIAGLEELLINGLIKYFIVINQCF